ncbi:Fimbrial assembly protein (PilN) [Bremerella volcania]|uniref:Fimbrial assembly protein (PilN) n=1 Tax=Bremerella volcania TaxID=2527984 RepID=A0A518CAA9_9BACT|nr:PilN domain-containing protein [Bremerella volcania]QDU76155.1 Fimbrial assembly protein (PilN) [Bremerella volcania]
MAEKRNNKKIDNRHVLALQIGHTKVRAVLYQLREGRPIACESLEEAWQEGGIKIATEEGMQGLRRALRSLLANVPRTVDKAYVALSGEFCVTRVVSDTNDNVSHEVREIESRSRLYLSLGHGPKVVAGSIVQQDPRHQHATVSVVHRQTIEAILDVAKSAGLSVIAVEPTVISLCRLMGAMGLDREAPSLLVCPGQSGVEIAVSFQGQLYLDYRPAGITRQEEIAEILVHHLERLQRYCRRHARVLKNSIASVYLTGEQYRAESIREQLGDRLNMPVQILETIAAESELTPLLRSVPISHYPAAGMGLLAIREYATPGPNLMERLKSDHEEHLLRRAAKVLGPIAAVMLCAVIAWGYLIEQRWHVQQLESQAAELDPIHRESLLLRGAMRRGRETLNVHQQIGRQLRQPDVAEWVHALGSKVPQNIWLTSISLDNEGDLTIEGNTTTEASIYTYSEEIGHLPFVNRATVDGAIPSATKAGPAIKFTIHCDIDAWENLEGKNDDSV